MSDFDHIPVLINETLDLLNLQANQNAIDATLGLGGHSSALARAIGPRGTLIAFEQDEMNLKQAKSRLKEFKNIRYVHNNFEHIKAEVEKLNVGPIHGILFDLGLSSPHVDDGARGFSFQKEGPLDMRYDRRQSLTAEKVVNTYNEKDLTEIIRNYGEDRRAPKLARRIVEARAESPIATTLQLAEVIASASKGRTRIHPATKTFQALRIYVNRELEVLETALSDAIDLLAPNGRIAVIAYHSLEDRIVKRIFKENAELGKKNKYKQEKDSELCQPKTLYLLTKKPIIPSGIEVSGNPRARSARLRVAKRV